MARTYDIDDVAIPLIGADAKRYESSAKVTGSAFYAGDEPLSGTLHAHLFNSAVAKGKVTAIDDAAARKVRGVRLVLTHRNMPKLGDTNVFTKGGATHSSFNPLAGTEVRYAGQILGLVAAETPEAAREAAGLVKVSIDPEKAVASIHAPNAPQAEAVPKEAYEPISKGDIEAALAGADATVEAEYRTPVQHHNPIELWFTSAEWRDGGLVAYVPSQWITGTRAALATAFDLPTEKVRVVSKYVGGGFGGKATVMNHTLIAAAAARMLGQPVKLYVGRDQMFTIGSFRPESTHRLRVGVKGGRLVALDHAQDGQTSRFDTFMLPGTEQTSRMYDWQAIRTAENLVRVDVNTPGFMRAPAETPGLFALESAIDEVALKAGIDPVALRLASDSDREPVEGLPWSSRSLNACLERGRDLFGWAERTPEPRSMTRDGWLIGYGVASSIYPAYFRAATARLRLGSDLSARLSAAGHELGGGTYTIVQQIVAEELGLAMDDVRVELGDSDLAPNGVAGGSTQTGSLGSATLVAARKVRDELASLAVAEGHPLAGADPKTLTFKGGNVRAGDRTARLADILALVPFGVVEQEGSWQPSSIGEKSVRELYRRGNAGQQGFLTDDFARAAFGAQFVEVAVDPATGEVRVPRMQGVFAAGRIMNERTARSQLMGGMIWGVSSILHEKTEIDHRHARFVNTDLGEYLMPVNADVPVVKVEMIEERDDNLNPLGVKGIGELGIVGVNAAVANALFHATGRRLREVPIRCEQVLEA